VGKPLVSLAQRLRGDRVQAAGALRAYAGEAVLAEDLQVLGHRGLGNAELVLDDRGHLARGSFAVGQEFQDPSADWVA
jgi:hypothetical protein